LGKKNCFGALSFQKLFLICVYWQWFLLIATSTKKNNSGQLHFTAKDKKDSLLSSILFSWKTSVWVSHVGFSCFYWCGHFQ
jgi:hypothetical protein